MKLDHRLLHTKLIKYSLKKLDLTSIWRRSIQKNLKDFEYLTSKDRLIMRKLGHEKKCFKRKYKKLIKNKEKQL